MDFFDDISLYLPQYLSNKDTLKKELKDFPTDGTTDTIYTSALNQVNYVLQGDCIDDMSYLNYPDTTVKKTPALLLSNTCDMSIENLKKRMNNCRILYTPLIRFDKYEALLHKKYTTEEDKIRINNHLKDVKSQFITQILYLPKGGKLQNDSIIFFDRAISLPLNQETVNHMCDRKIFTFSNFGFYLFLLKISIHFTRIQEQIDRDAGVDLTPPNTDFCAK